MPREVPRDVFVAASWQGRSVCVVSADWVQLCSLLISVWLDPENIRMLVYCEVLHTCLNVLFK